MKRKKIRNKIKFRLLGTKQLKGRRQQSGYTYIQERGMFRREDKQTNRKISKKKKKLSLANTLSKSTLPKNLAPMIPIPNHHIQKKKKHYTGLHHLLLFQATTTYHTLFSTKPKKSIDQFPYSLKPKSTTVQP